MRAGSRAVIYVILQNASHAIQVTFWKMVLVILALQDSHTQSNVILLSLFHVILDTLLMEVYAVYAARNIHNVQHATLHYVYHA